MKLVKNKKPLAFLFFFVFAICSLFFNKKIKKKVVLVDGERRDFFISNKVSIKKKYNVFIFFHGLEESPCLSNFTKNIFKQLEERARKHNILVVFPIGLKGAFKEAPELLAWGPKLKKKNINFVKELLLKLKTDYTIDKIILGGFSNGSYFCLDLFMNNYEEEFYGYWLQGGGVVQGNFLIKKLPKIILEVGINDHWNLNSMQCLYNYFIERGWEDNKNLIYRRLNNGHIFDISFFDENLDFFMQDINNGL